MIEINLLPGARRKARRAGPSFDLAGSLASIRERIRQPWLIGSVPVGGTPSCALPPPSRDQTRPGTEINQGPGKAVATTPPFALVLLPSAKAQGRPATGSP